MLLYDNAISGNCWKVRQLLAHLGIPFERREVEVIDRSDRREVLADLNPARRIPTLVLDDGRPLAESNAILAYFAEDTPYLPTDRYERAQVLQWLFFEQYTHEPAVAIARFLVSYAPEGTASPKFIAHKQQEAATAIGMMERHLASREFFVGDAYSIADIALYAYTHVAPEADVSLVPYPAVRAWIDRVAAQPDHVLITADRARRAARRTPPAPAWPRR